MSTYYSASSCITGVTGSYYSVQDNAVVRVADIEACKREFRHLDVTGRVNNISPRTSGRGGSADVRQAEYVSGEHAIVTVALKIARVRSPGPDFLRRFAREVAVWRTFKHPNLLPLYGLSWIPALCDLPAMVSPWYGNGTVLDYLAQQPAMPTYKYFALKLRLESSQGLAYLHSVKVFHGDLKGDNILVSDHGVACIADFGISAVLSQYPLQDMTAGGTYRWMAPELLRDGRSLTCESDVWAFGCVILEVVSGERPFHAVPEEAKVILALHDGSPPPRPHNMPDLAWDLCQSCLSLEPRDRVSVTLIMDQLQAALATTKIRTIETLARTILSEDTGSPSQQLHSSHVLVDKVPFRKRLNGALHGEHESIILPSGEPPSDIPTGNVPLSALIERLTHPTYLSSSFMDTFMLTFKSFTTPDQVLELLMQRYFFRNFHNAHPNLSENLHRVAQFRVMDILIIMLRTGLVDGKRALARCRAFASWVQEELGAASQPLVDMLAHSAPIPIALAPPRLQPPGPAFTNWVASQLNNMSRTELASQLTVVEAHLLKKLNLADCLRSVKESRSTQSVNDIVTMQNAVSMWVVNSILHPWPSGLRQRAAVLARFIHIAERCRDMQNYSSMTTIVATITSTVIPRLNAVLEFLRPRHVDRLRSLLTLVEEAKDFKVRKVFMSKIQPPAVPFLGTYLSTLSAIEDSASDNIPGAPNEPLLVNVSKQYMFADVLREIRRCQLVPYDLTPAPRVIALLEYITQMQFDLDRALGTGQI